MPKQIDAIKKKKKKFFSTCFNFSIHHPHNGFTFRVRFPSQHKKKKSKFGFDSRI
jgi:hypothetical protein